MLRVQASGAAAVQKMSAVARQRSDCSPQKTKAIRQPSFAENAEAESKEEQDRKRREDDAGRKREERKRLEELQRRKDEEEAEDAARRIVDSSSRFARLKLEEEQQQKKLLQQQTDDVLKCSSPPQPACPPAVPSSQREEGAAPARAGASSPVKKYLRNELRCAPLRCAAIPKLQKCYSLRIFTSLFTVAVPSLSKAKACTAVTRAVRSRAEQPRVPARRAEEAPSPAHVRRQGWDELSHKTVSIKGSINVAAHRSHTETPMAFVILAAEGKIFTMVRAALLLASALQRAPAQKNSRSTKDTWSQYFGCSDLSCHRRAERRSMILSDLRS